MRTTVTIDADTEHLLRSEVKRTGRSFKEVLNPSIRRALLSTQGESADVRVEPLFREPFPAEFAGTSLNVLADQLDDEDTLKDLSR